MFLFKIFIFSITLNESLETKYVERDVTDVFSDFGDDDTSTSHHVKNNVRKCTEGHTFYMDTKHKMPSCYKFSSIINMTGNNYVLHKYIFLFYLLFQLYLYYIVDYFSDNIT